MTTIKDKIGGRIAVLRAELAELETAARVIDRIASNGDIYWTDGAEPERLGGVDGVIDTPPEHDSADAGRSPSESNGTNGESDSTDLSGKTMMECAKVILAESHNTPLHYREMYYIAVKRGYTSGRAKGGSPTSFWALMKRDKTGTFESAGTGRFKLTQKGVSDVKF